MFIQHCYYTKKRCEANHRNLSRDTWQHTWLDTSSAAALCKLCVTICCNIPPRHYSIARPRFEVGKLGINDWKRWFRQHTSAFISVIKYLNLNSGWRKLGALVLPLDSNCESEVLTSRVKSFIFLTSMYISTSIPSLLSPTLSQSVKRNSTEDFYCHSCSLPEKTVLI